MQRLFSTFADGWPGAGILLIRLLAGAGLIRGAASGVHPEPNAGSLPLHMIAAAAGVLILVGLWTPIVGATAGVLELWIWLTHPALQSSAIVLATLGASIAMIGPGAWSIDARLYGRKQILPPEF